jgi:hypothetical protein
MPDYGMPGMDNMTEFKLFIGMLPRTVGEDGLRAIFQPYGSIIEVVVLREPDGSSRGCAFVKYHRREDAVNAINACNGQMFFQVHHRNLASGAICPMWFSSRVPFIHNRAKPIP